MSNVLFCIEVRKDRLLGVKLAAGPYVNLVVGCADVKTNIWPMDRAVSRLKEEAGFEEGRVLLTFAPELLLIRNLKVPFIEKKKIEQILPMELVETLPVEVETLLIDFTINKSGGDGADIMAGMLPKELLSSVLSALSAEGIHPENVGIGGVSTCLNLVDDEEKDFVLLDLQATGVTIYLFVGSKIVLVRAATLDVKKGGTKQIVNEVLHTLIASGHEDMLNSHGLIYLTGLVALHDGVVKSLRKELGDVDIRIYQQSKQPLTKINNVIRDKYRPGIMDGLLADAVRGGEYDGYFNYLKDEFKKRKTGEDYRRNILKYAVPALACIVLFVGYQTYSYNKLTSRHEALKNQIVSVFKKTLPEATKTHNPVKQLTILNKGIGSTYGSGGARGESGYSMIDLLTEISVRISPSYKVKIVRLVADLDTMRIRGLTKDFNTVDNIQKELQKSEYFSEVDINSATQSTRDDEVRFELKLLLTK